MQPTRRVNALQTEAKFHGCERIFRLPDVIAICGLSKSQIHLMMHRGEFPQNVQLGQRAVGWRSSEIQDWVQSKFQQARMTPKKLTTSSIVGNTHVSR